ncbi:MAG: hypothetical protein MMC33_001441 [Icmadophila ericetorum]|nr:hypothetical protein [Icmadophila ericetorum]
MATSTKVHVDIFEEGDVVIRVWEHENNDKTQPVRQITDFKVKKELLLWLFHSKFTDESYQVPYPELWTLIMACDKYPVNHKRFKPWFAIPTKYFAYQSVGHIEEPRVVGHPGLNLPYKFISQLCVARGGLRTILGRSISKLLDALFEDADRSCKEATTHNYQKALRVLRIKSFEDFATKISIAELCTKLGGSKFMRDPKAYLRSCHKSYEDLMKLTVTRTKGYFDGLCLDCINHGKPKLKGYNEEDDYRWFRDLDEEWNEGFRIKHGEPTCYFFVHARREKENII